MTQRKKLLIALIGVSVASLVVGTSTLAATTKSQILPKKSDCIRMEFDATSGASRKHPLEQFISQLTLATTQKNQLDKLMLELKTARKNYQKERKSVNDEAEKAKLKEQREKKKSEIKVQMLALIPADQKVQFEQFLSKPKGDRPFNKKWSKPKSWNSLGFLWEFLDENKLTDVQKTEIQLLQKQKSEQMKKLLEQMRSPSNDAQKAEIEAQLQKVNQDFLTGLKKYISADKVAEYEKFISEAKVWNKKAEKKSKHSSYSSTKSSSAKKQKELSTAL